jgi:hypothetical protein
MLSCDVAGNAPNGSTLRATCSFCIAKGGDTHNEDGTANDSFHESLHEVTSNSLQKTYPKKVRKSGRSHVDYEALTVCRPSCDL